MRGSRAGTSILAVLVLIATAAAQTPAARDPDWKKLEAETLQHFQSLLRLDTTNPPGNETRAVEYLSRVLTEGIPFQTFALEPSRANLVARLKGNGRK